MIPFYHFSSTDWSIFASDFRRLNIEYAWPIYAIHVPRCSASAINASGRTRSAPEPRKMLINPIQRRRLWRVVSSSWIAVGGGDLVIKQNYNCTRCFFILRWVLCAHSGALDTPPLYNPMPVHCGHKSTSTGVHKSQNYVWNLWQGHLDVICISNYYSKQNANLHRLTQKVRLLVTAGRRPRRFMVAGDGVALHFIMQLISNWQFNFASLTFSLSLSLSLPLTRHTVEDNSVTAPHSSTIRHYIHSIVGNNSSNYPDFQ